MLKLKHLVPLFLALFFLILGLLWVPISNNPLSERKSRSEFQDRSTGIGQVEKEAAIFLKKATENPSWQIRGRFFFFDGQPDGIGMDNQRFSSDARTVQDNFTLKLLHVTQGDFLVKKWPIRGPVSCFRFTPPKGLQHC